MEVLNEKGIPLQVFVYPERFMQQEDVKRRKFALIEIHKRGVSKASLTAIGPYTMRHLDRILNGCASHETHEALGESDATGQTESNVRP